MLAYVSDKRLGQYEARTGVPLGILGVGYLCVYAWPILDVGMAASVRSACGWVGWLVWLVFGVDYAIRLALAEQRTIFVRRNWFDLLVLVVPLLRPVRALRGLVALRLLGRGDFARGRIVVAIASTIGAAGAVAALAILDAERADPDANIRDYGDALWWAISTITTVGYGDRYPVTSEGRFIAAALMVGGIALLGVVTASLASWFVERVGEAARTEQDIESKLDAMTEEIRALRALVDQQRRPV